MTDVTAQSKVAARQRAMTPARLWASWRIFVYRMALVIGFFLLWETAINLGWLKVYFYGQPTGIIEEMFKRIADGTLIRDIGVTAWEALLGFLIGGVAGSLCGLGLWLAPTLAKVLQPIIVALNGLPKIALAPLLIVWFGLGIESKVAIAAIITFLVGLITAYAGTREIDADLIKLMRSLGARRTQIFTKIVLPASVPWVISGFRLNVGFALIGAVAGEFIAANRGLGYMVYYAGQTYELNAVWLGIFALMALAIIMDQLVGLIEARFKRQ